MAETPFVNFGLEKYACVALQKLPLLENGNPQTISLWKFLGHIFIHRGFLKNNCVTVDACKKLHVLGRQASCASMMTKQGRGKFILLKPYGLFSVLRNYTICKTAVSNGKLYEKSHRLALILLLRTYIPCTVSDSFNVLKLWEKNQVSQDWKEKDGTFSRDSDCNQETNYHSNNKMREMPYVLNQTHIYPW